MEVEMSQGIAVSDWAGTIYSDKKRYFNPHAGVRNAKRRIKIYGNPLLTLYENPFPSLRGPEVSKARRRRKANKELGEKARVEKGRVRPERGIRLTSFSRKERKWGVKSIPRLTRSEFLRRGPPDKFRITETEYFRIIEFEGCRIVRPSLCSY